jgi:hypothetical protein
LEILYNSSGVWVDDPIRK